MPDYPPGTSTRGITMVQRLMPVFTAPYGFVVLATCPVGKTWKTDTIALQNNHATKTFAASLQLIPNGWIGAVAAPDLAVFQNIVLKPRQMLLFNYTLGLNAGSAFWGFQLEDVTAFALQGITLTIAGTET